MIHWYISGNAHGYLAGAFTAGLFHALFIGHPAIAALQAVLAIGLFLKSKQFARDYRQYLEASALRQNQRKTHHERHRDPSEGAA